MDKNIFPNYSYIGINPQKPKNIGKISGIYLIFCTVSGKKYVGQSVNIANRWRGHVSSLRINKSHSPKLQESWNLHGEKSHVFSLLDNVVDLSNLDKVEQRFIDSMSPELNCAIMAKGFRHTEESKEKMRKNHADVSGVNNPMYGVKLTGDQNPMFGRKRPDTAEFNTRTKKGKPRSPEHSEKISNSLRANKNASKI